MMKSRCYWYVCYCLLLSADLIWNKMRKWKHRYWHDVMLFKAPPQLWVGTTPGQGNAFGAWTGVRGWLGGYFSTLKCPEWFEWFEWFEWLDFQRLLFFWFLFSLADFNALSDLGTNAFEYYWMHTMHTMVAMVFPLKAVEKLVLFRRREHQRPGQNWRITTLGVQDFPRHLKFALL